MDDHEFRASRDIHIFWYRRDGLPPKKTRCYMGGEDVSTVWVKNLEEFWVKQKDPNATWCSPCLMGDRGKIQEEKHVRKKTPFYYVAGFMDVDGM